MDAPTDQGAPVIPSKPFESPAARARRLERMRARRELRKLAANAGGPQPFLPKQPPTLAEEAALAKQRKRPPKSYPYLIAAQRLSLLDAVAWISIAIGSARSWPIPEAQRGASISALQDIAKDLRQALESLGQPPGKK